MREPLALTVALLRSDTETKKACCQSTASFFALAAKTRGLHDSFLKETRTGLFADFRLGLASISYALFFGISRSRSQGISDSCSNWFAAKMSAMVVL